MNTFIRTIRMLAAASGMLAVALLGASPPAGMPAAWESAGFHATVSGTSTLHAWSVEAREATGEFKASDSGTGMLRIPAKALSGGPKGLNERMYAALKADAHPTISFEALALKLPENLTTTSAVSVRGRLNIAGGSREITLACRVSMPAPGELVLETETPLTMSDYGIKPPTFMGMIRTGDVVTVRVRWQLRPVTTNKALTEPLATR